MLTAGAVGDAVLVYHPYCMGLPEAPFRAFFQQMGASEFNIWQSGRPRVVARARGRNDIVELPLDEYLELANVSPYPSELEEAPPWGGECEDDRLRTDEDRSARIGDGVCEFDQTSDGIRLALPFSNSFAGALALHAWLVANGYTDVELSIETAPLPLEKRLGTAVAAHGAGRFDDDGARKDAPATSDPAEVVASWFRAGRLPDSFLDALVSVSLDRLAELALEEARSYWARGLDVTRITVRIIERLFGGPEREQLARELWEHLIRERSAWLGLAVRAIAHALPPDEAFARATAWCEEAKTADERARRLRAMTCLSDARTLDLVEHWWQSEQHAPVTEKWSRIVIHNDIPWPTARRWIESGGALARIAVDALRWYANNDTLTLCDRPRLAEFREVLGDYAAKDAPPELRPVIERLIAYPTTLVSQY